MVARWISVFGCNFGFLSLSAWYFQGPTARRRASVHGCVQTCTHAMYVTSALSRRIWLVRIDAHRVHIADLSFSKKL